MIEVVNLRCQGLALSGGFAVIHGRAVFGHLFFKRGHSAFEVITGIFVDILELHSGDAALFIGIG